MRSGVDAPFTFKEIERILCVEGAISIRTCGCVTLLFPNLFASRAGKLQTEQEFEKVASLLGVNKSAMLEASPMNMHNIVAENGQLSTGLRLMKACS